MNTALASPGEGEIRAARGQRKANPPPKDAPVHTGGRTIGSCLAGAATPREAGAHPVLSSPTANSHFSGAHTLGITGNRRLYIEVGTTLPSPPGAEGLPRMCSLHLPRRRRTRNAGSLICSREPACAPFAGLLPRAQRRAGPAYGSPHRAKGPFACGSLPLAADQLILPPALAFPRALEAPLL